jgi:long-chain fatty acid transport protein
MNSSHNLRRCLLAFGLLLVVASSSRAQYGPLLTGVGSGNRSIGGVATALPLDPVGALRWNPATLSGFRQSQMEFSVEALYPRTRISSSVAPNAFGQGFPATTLAGTTDGESGIAPLPSFGLVWVPEESRFTFGFGVTCVGGFSLNYPGSTTNPILTPQPPRGFGVGNLYALFQLFEITPTVSYQITDRLSLGFSGILGLSTLEFDPGFVFTPDDANGDGFTTFPAGTHTRTNFGGGFQIGLFWQDESGWNLGASVKSPVWFERFRYFTQDELGRPRTTRFGLEEPMILSAGVSYTGIENLSLGVDFRFIDFRNTRGFRDFGFDSTGAVQGVGWSSMYVIALGGAYQVSDRLGVRAGYSFNNNPIDQNNAFFNIASPLLIQHVASAGAFFDLTTSLQLSLSYVRIFEGTASGPFYTRTGPVPGTNVSIDSTADSLVLGVKVKF